MGVADWMIGNLASITAGIVAAVIALFSIISIVKERKKCGCGCRCSSCGGVCSRCAPPNRGNTKGKGEHHEAE